MDQTENNRSTPVQEDEARKSIFVDSQSLSKDVSELNLQEAPPAADERRSSKGSIAELAEEKVEEVTQQDFDDGFEDKRVVASGAPVPERRSSKGS